MRKLEHHVIALLLQNFNTSDISFCAVLYKEIESLLSSAIKIVLDNI